MTYSPPREPVPTMVSAFSPWGVAREVGGIDAAGSPSSGAFEGNNNAAYMPVVVPVTCVARRLWWVNGSTVSASYNVDCGIYADSGGKPGARLVSTGSTAQGTASQVQFVDITDTVLAPGRYFIALACSSSSATFFRSSSTAAVLNSTRFQQTSSAFPLPATATPIEGTAATIYVFGFATTASP